MLQRRKVGHSLGELMASQASVMLMGKVAEVAEENLERHLLPEQVDQLREVLDELTMD